jgi:hypothetical protein
MATEAITYSANVPHVKYACGLLTSDGTIAYIETGFTPVKIVAVNYTGTNPLMYMWQKGQAEANCFLNTGSTGVITKGVTGPYPYGDTSDDTAPTTQYTVGQSETFRGFSIPDAITADGDTWTWEAWGE